MDIPEPSDFVPVPFYSLIKAGLGSVLCSCCKVTTFGILKVSMSTIELRIVECADVHYSPTMQSRKETGAAVG